MDNYINLKIDKLIKETPDSITLELSEIKGKKIEFLPGQFLTFIYNIDGEEIRRGYSISSSPDKLPKLNITIKRIADGFVSDHIFDTLKEGLIIKSLPPLGNFTVGKPNGAKRNLVFFGAGSGITPLTSMIKYTLENDPLSCLTLFYGNRDEESIIYESLFNELEEKYGDRFKVTHILSKPRLTYKGLKGRITKDFVSEFIKNQPESILDSSDFYLCGPDGMMQNIISALREAGIDSQKIHREIYTTSVIENDEETEDIARKVTIIFQEKEHHLIIEPGESILQTALDNGLDLPNSCQYGSCASCRAKLLSGKLKLVDQTALSEEEINKGYCLTCVGFPVSDNVVILYED